MRILLLPAVAMLSGCSWMFGDTFRDRAMDYLEAEEQAPTRTEQDIRLLTSDAYAIPVTPVTPVKPSGFETPQPQRFIAEDDDTDSVASLSEYRSEALNPRLEKDGAGTLILRLDGGFAGAWASVTEALSASALKLTDLNRSTGTFYLEMQTRNDAEQLSWWDRFWGKDNSVTETYLLKMNRARQGVYLSLLTDADNLAGEALTADVLNEIKAQLEK
ncbi:MAG: outer membrane protein assembly factor BamC [Saccharospirillaceae bacterium]|nr:outer membrane protein assembly factor BamC [Saccharospirillaceae bacterium]MCD8531619.1 outer membrane protein assembly factor BamC [Saccharospirillaceae bacterium]